MDWLATILTSGNLLNIIILVVVLVILTIVLVKTKILEIHTQHVSLGNIVENYDMFCERRIIRSQIERAHDFCMSLESKIFQIKPNMPHKGYLTKYILECVYSEVIKWITFNHIDNSEAYISCKQKTIKYLVYNLTESEEFKTPEFQERINEWVKEMILELIEIRRLFIIQKNQKENK